MNKQARLWHLMKRLKVQNALMDWRVHAYINERLHCSHLRVSPRYFISRNIRLTIEKYVGVFISCMENLGILFNPFQTLLK